MHTSRFGPNVGMCLEHNEPGCQPFRLTVRPADHQFRALLDAVPSRGTRDCNAGCSGSGRGLARVSTFDRKTASANVKVEIANRVARDL
jgi:hypothetical protein